MLSSTALRLRPAKGFLGITGTGGAGTDDNYGVEIRGDESARGEATVQATSESGQGLHGCGGEEHGLRRF